MSATDFFLIVFLLSAIFYWLDSIRAKEVATEQAKNSCKNTAVEFLDDTVLIKKTRVKRNSYGRIVFYREFDFEFSSTGEFRYHGLVKLLGKHLVDIEMEAYQVKDDSE